MGPPNCGDFASSLLKLVDETTHHRCPRTEKSSLKSNV